MFQRNGIPWSTLPYFEKTRQRICVLHSDMLSSAPAHKLKRMRTCFCFFFNVAVLFTTRGSGRYVASESGSLMNHPWVREGPLCQQQPPRNNGQQATACRNCVQKIKRQGSKMKQHPTGLLYIIYYTEGFYFFVCSWE